MKVFCEKFSNTYSKQSKKLRFFLCDDFESLQVFVPYLRFVNLHTCNKRTRTHVILERPF